MIVWIVLLLVIAAVGYYLFSNSGPNPNPKPDVPGPKPDEPQSKPK